MVHIVCHFVSHVKEVILDMTRHVAVMYMNACSHYQTSSITMVIDMSRYQTLMVNISATVAHRRLDLSFSPIGRAE